MYNRDDDDDDDEDEEVIFIPLISIIIMSVIFHLTLFNRKYLFWRVQQLAGLVILLKCEI
jgi:hypothetical protein